VEFDDILREMEKDKEPLPPNHPLARGLRRGIGMCVRPPVKTVLMLHVAVYAYFP
jgi:hypothetical protein